MVTSLLGEADPDDTLDERGFYTDLARHHAAFVPVVGAGLSKTAGAPGFADLIKHLLGRAATGGTTLTVTAADPPFKVVDAIAAALGESWVQEEVGGFYRDCELKPTAPLKALAKVRSGLVVTTNYDLAIETAAEAIGRAYETLTLDQFDVALAVDREVLQVVHLHGVCTHPPSIVLTARSYAEMLGSEKSKLLLRALGTTHRLIFLGHSLDVREEHIRRDLSWTINAASSPRDPHLLVTNAPATSDPAAIAFKTELETNAQIKVVQFGDPEREYQASVRAAHAISRPSTVETDHQAPVVDSQELDVNYLPLPMAESRRLSEIGGLGAYTAMVWQEGEILSTDLDTTEPLLVIEAEGGAGKSQELLQIARRSTRPALVQHLANVQVEPAWEDPGPRFVAAMTTAQATQPGVPRLTLEGLRDGSFTLLLDGLDEIAAVNRPRVLQLLIDVARCYPQHRYVIGSRPLPEVAGQDTFARWTPMTDLTWVSTYAESRGVESAKLQEALPETGDISDLITIPIYTAAAVGRVYVGAPLPATALELVCGLVDQWLGIDTRIQATAEAIQTWLDRLALAMQMTGLSEISATELAASGLHDGLPDLEPTEETLGELARRALLRDSNASLGSPPT